MARGYDPTLAERPRISPHPLRIGSTLDPSIPTRLRRLLLVPMLVSQVQQLAHSRRPSPVSANLPSANRPFTQVSDKVRSGIGPPTPRDTRSNTHLPSRPLPYSGFLRLPDCTRRLRQHLLPLVCSGTEGLSNTQASRLVRRWGRRKHKGIV